MGSKVFTAMNIKIIVLWDVAPCTSVTRGTILEESVISIFRAEE
jgi:hypothetical protein